MTRFVAMIATLSVFATPLAAQSLDSRIDRELPSLVETYKKLHSAPELSGQERNSSEFVAAQLRALGYDVIDHIGKYDAPNLTGYGVVGVMKNGKGPTVLVRTDMDGLPVKEATGLPYASTVVTKDPNGQEVSVMHACGHDVHMTTFLGTAKMLADLRKQWRGTLILVGQPAEEIGRGADAMLRDDVYQKAGKPDFALALHDSATLPAGQIGYCPGYALANIDAVDVTIRGVGGHGALPQATRDPIVVAAQFIMALQTIVSRENSPLDPAVITVGSIHGGAKRNVIPDEVKLQLTVRSYKDDVRQHLLASIERIAKGVAEAAGIPADRAPIVQVLEAEAGNATYNDPQLVDRLVPAWQKALGAANVVKVDPVMVSEDFGSFGLAGRQIPITLFWLGAVDPAKVEASRASGAPLPPLHSSRFAPLPEPTLRTGIKAMTTAVMELMK